MREIKFRAWDHFNAVFYQSDNLGMEGFWKSVNMAVEGLNPVTVEQYTGLKDRNGKKVYDGDLLKQYGDGPILEVAWDQEEGMWIVKGSIVLQLRCYVKYYFVVGNIHENSELVP